MTGCINSIPKLTTSECQPGGGIQVLLHGLDFRGPDMQFEGVDISFGQMKCMETSIVNPWVVACVLPTGTGEGHGVNAQFRRKAEKK